MKTSAIMIVLIAILFFMNIYILIYIETYSFFPHCELLERRVTESDPNLKQLESICPEPDPHNKLLLDVSGQIRGKSSTFNTQSFKMSSLPISLILTGNRRSYIQNFGMIMQLILKRIVVLCSANLY